MKDGYHELHVYKIDKKFDMTNPTYLDLPSIKHNLSPKASHLFMLLLFTNFYSPFYVLKQEPEPHTFVPLEPDSILNKTCIQ